jgi:hypothetical protein
MKGIYLTEDGKKAIEDRIVKLHEDWKGKVGYNMMLFNIDILKELLSSATILPVEESWEGVSRHICPMVEVYYPNGVIIKSKQ